MASAHRGESSHVLQSIKWGNGDSIGDKQALTSLPLRMLFDMQTSTSIFSRLSVPDDVLHRIFEFCMVSDPGISNGHTTKPIILSRVCHSWRALTWGLPSLWKSIEVFKLGVPGTDIRDLDKILRSANHSLVRSQPCAVDIWILIVSHDQLFDPEEDDDLDENRYFANLDMFRSRMHMLSRLLVMNTHRIRKLDVLCDELVIVVDLFRFMPRYTRMPQLEAISIRNTGVGDVFEDANLRLDPSRVQREWSILLQPRGGSRERAAQYLYPCLNSVTIQGLPLEWGRFCPVKLKALTLEEVPELSSSAAVWNVLRANGDTLTLLCLNNSEFFPDEPVHHSSEREPRSPYLLPKLDALSFRSVDPQDVITFFSYAQLPSLTCLALVNIQLDLEDRMALIKTLTEDGVLYRLRELELVNIQLCSAGDDLDQVTYVPNFLENQITSDAFSFFTALQSLQRLVLKNADEISLNTLNYLAPGGGGGGGGGGAQEAPHSVPVPALSSLTLSCSSYYQLNKFLEMRRLGGELYKQRFRLELEIPKAWQPCVDHIPSITSVGRDTGSLYYSPGDGDGMEEESVASFSSSCVCVCQSHLWVPPPIADHPYV